MWIHSWWQFLRKVMEWILDSRLSFLMEILFCITVKLIFCNVVLQSCEKSKNEDRLTKTADKVRGRWGVLGDGRRLAGDTSKGCTLTLSHRLCPSPEKAKPRLYQHLDNLPLSLHLEWTLPLLLFSHPLSTPCLLSLSLLFSLFSLLSLSLSLLVLPKH